MLLVDAKNPRGPAVPTGFGELCGRSLVYLRLAFVRRGAQ